MTEFERKEREKDAARVRKLAMRKAREDRERDDFDQWCIAQRIRLGVKLEGSVRRIQNNKEALALNEAKFEHRR